MLNMEFILAGLMLAVVLVLYYRIIQGKTTFDNQETAVKQFVIPMIIFFLIRQFIIMLLYGLNVFPIIADIYIISELLMFSTRALIDITVLFLILKCMNFKERITFIKIGIAFMAYIMDWAVWFISLLTVITVAFLLYDVTGLEVLYNFMEGLYFINPRILFHVVSIPIHFGIYQLIKRRKWFIKS